MRRLILLSVCCAVAALTGCGNKGPLYLPKPTPAAHPTAAPAHTVAPAHATSIAVPATASTAPTPATIR